MKQQTTLSIVALACALCATAAHAGRPLQTEDAGVVERGDCELEGASARLKFAGISGRETGLQIGCGVGASTQLALAASGAKAEGVSAHGLEFNGKTTLWTGAAAKDEEAASLALAYALSSVKVSGDKWRHAATELNLAYSRPLPSELTLHANLGHARDEIGGTTATTWGLAPWWNLGLRYTAVPDKLFIDASYGRQMASGRPTLLTVGFKFAF
jgi:hypothetical protein